MSSAVSRGRDQWPHDLPDVPRSAEMVTQLLTRRLAATTATHVEVLNATVIKTVSTFTSLNFDAVATSHELAGRYWTMGARSAPDDAKGLSGVFKAARQTASDGVRIVLAGRTPAQNVAELQSRVQQLVDQLTRHVHRGYHEAAEYEYFGDPADAEEWRSRIHGEAAYVVLAPTTPRPPKRLTIKGALRRITTNDLLIPADTPLDEVADQLEDVYVSGPVRPLWDCHSIEAMVRACAQTLRRTPGFRAEPIVPCSDLLGYVAFYGIPGAADVLAEKHFSALAQWHARQRLQAAQVLNAWLNTGQNVNQIARDLGIPQQTAHRRLHQGLNSIEAPLDHPISRVEIIIGLALVLPRWKAEAEQDAQSGKKRRRKDSK